MSIHNAVKHFILYQMPAIALAVLIFILSSMPDIPMPQVEFKMQDKIIHFLVYAVFGVLLGRALFFQDRFLLLKKNYIFFAILIGILYGVSDEFHQLYVPGRSADVLDLIADALGVIAGVFLFRIWQMPQRVSSPAQ